MPMYDYKCTKCGTVFEELVFSNTVADDQIKMPEMQSIKGKAAIVRPLYPCKLWF